MDDPLTALAAGTLLLALLSFLFWPKGGLVGYFQHVSRMNQKETSEDALKHMHHAERMGKATSVESLAGELDISPSKAAALLQSMQSKELVSLAGGGFKLTPSGNEYALRVIRAHRLWERYLAEETGFEEAKWHDLAERYEHKLTPERTDALAAQLGHPTHDPHGDPIPSAQGDFVAHGGQPLPEVPEGAHYQIVHMEDEPEAVYAQLAAEGLHPGMSVQLIESTPQRVRFWANGEEHLLARIVAHSISVRQLSGEVQGEACTGVPLHRLKPGQQGKVASLSPRLRGAERRRMMDLGILPGTIIRSEMVSPAGDPTAYRIRGALVALRREQAGYICVNEVQEAAE